MRISSAAVLFLSLLSPFHTGCRPGGPFPQYSGLYVLEEAVESEEGVAGTLKPPRYLRVTHRMEFTGSYFRHVLGFQAVPYDLNEANGQFSGELARLLHTGHGVFPQPADFSGTPFRPSKPIDESHGAFCNLNSYEYRAAIPPGALVPDPELLKKVYPRHSDKPEDWTGPEVYGSDPEEGKILIESAEDSVIDEAAVAEWNRQLADNGGMTLTLTFSKHTDGTFSGCEPGEAYFTEAEYDTGTLTLRYRAQPGAEDNAEDIREAPMEDAVEGSGGSLPDQLTSFE